MGGGWRGHSSLLAHCTSAAAKYGTASGPNRAAAPHECHPSKRFTPALCAGERQRRLVEASGRRPAHGQGVPRSLPTHLLAFHNCGESRRVGSASAESADYQTRFVHILTGLSLLFDMLFIQFVIRGVPCITEVAEHCPGLVDVRIAGVAKYGHNLHMLVLTDGMDVIRAKTPPPSRTHRHYARLIGMRKPAAFL